MTLNHISSNYKYLVNNKTRFKTELILTSLLQRRQQFHSGKKPLQQVAPHHLCRLCKEPVLPASCTSITTVMIQNEEDYCMDDNLHLLD